MKKQTWSACLILFILLFVTPISGATNNMDISWPTFQGNAAHNGYVPVSLDANMFEEKWQQTFDLPLNPVSVANGKVFVSLYIPFQDSELVALDGEDGAELWKESYGQVNSVGAPSYGDGNVYIQTNFHWDNMDMGTYLHAYQANETKVEVFKSPFPAQFVKYYAPTVYDGKVYMNAGQTGGVFAFYATDEGDDAAGELYWEKDDMLYYDQWTPAVNDQYVYVYVGDGSNRYPTAALYVIDRNTGIEQFRIEDPDFFSEDLSMRSAPVIGGLNDILVIQSNLQGGRLISFDLQQQRIRWVVESSFTGQPSVCNGVVYAIDNGFLTAWDEATGDPLWSLNDLGDTLDGNIIVTDTHAFAGNSTSTYAIDLETKESFLLHDSGGHLALGNDSLYIASNTPDIDDDDKYYLTAIRIGGDSPSAEPPIANAGPDLIGIDEITLDGTQSLDPDGEIVSYVWQIQPKEDETTELGILAFPNSDMVVEGKSHTLSYMEPGFYNVTLVVTDNDGMTAEDTLLLAVAGECNTRPQPNVAFDIKRFKINKYKRWNWTTATFLSFIDLPDLEFSRRDRAKAVVTIEIDLPNGEDLILQDEINLKVRNSKHRLKLYK